MLTRCYSVYDRKSLFYASPFFAPTDGAAVRTLSEAVGDPQHPIGRHPLDYVMYFVGTFDSERGAMAPVSPLIHVIDANSLVKAMQQEVPFPEGTTSVADQVRRAANGEDR